ncbi:MAG: GGDEF domain-containing protein [Acidimicrobiales bacterium]|nr:GGDEF domain-containing protein [Acidimicrobiales bacterium]
MGGTAARRGRPDDALLARVVIDDTAPAAILDADLRVVYANEAFRRYGWEPEELLGEHPFDWLHPDDLPRAASTIGVLHTRVGDGTAPYRLRRRDGTYEMLDVATVLIDGPDGTEYVAFSLRPNPFDRARTRSFSAMVAGEGPESSLEGLGDRFSPSRPGALIAFDSGGRRLGLGWVPPVLGGIVDGRQDHTPGAPWTEAMETLTPVTVTEPARLPDPVRQAAQARGLHAAAFIGSPDPGRPQPALLAAWAPDPAMADLLAVNLGDIETLVRLALDRRASSERLEHLAHHDALTGLANRARFFTLLETALADAVPVAVAYLDLDGFKGVNDRHGHAAGDHLLVELAGRFGREMRADDVVARLGGDEFAVLIHRPPDAGAAAAVVERLLDAARTPVLLPDGVAVTLAASAGLTLAGADRGADPDAIVHEADTALYDAKRAGKGTLVVAGTAPGARRRRDDPVAGSPSG